ncbi:MAG: hypothetical protein ABI540_05525 [Spartobacteria bacterium]
MAITLTAEIGFRLGRRWHPQLDDMRRGHLGAVLGSVLGLLALLLSFTFALSHDRHEARRQLVLKDANALEALYLESTLLPEPPRQRFKQLLGQYVNLHAQVAQLRRDATPKEAAKAADAASAIHREMWQLITTAPEVDPSSRSAQEFRRRLIAVLEVQHERLFAAESHVPDPVILLLMLGAAMATGAIGLFGGMGNHRGIPARAILAVLLGATIYVLLDLDRPHEGFIDVSQSPILDLKVALARDPEVR